MIIKYKNQPFEFPEGTSLLEMADCFQDEYECPILLAFVNRDLTELNYVPKDFDEISFVTFQDGEGQITYQRSAVMMLIKAFYYVVRPAPIESFNVCFSMGDNLFIKASGGFEITDELLDQVYDKMMEMVKDAIPFAKSEMTRLEAMDLFRLYGMEEKSRLFHFRQRSRVKLYHLGGYTDYFYSYMVPDTSKVTVFALKKYEDGFLLRFPRQSDPFSIPPFNEESYIKLYTCLKESEEWAQKLDIHGVAALNDRITHQGASELILIQEALMEKKIGQIAEQISENGKKIILIAGPSSSGKTTFAHRLAVQLKALGHRTHHIETDNYFKSIDQCPRHPDGSYNFDSFDFMDTERFNQDMQSLLRLERIQLPYYNFLTGIPEEGEWKQLQDNDILIIEGIHCLNDKFSYSLNPDDKFRIYISALSQFHIDEHNSVSASDIRLIRRIVRDNRIRGMNPKRTLEVWDSVRMGEKVNIFPYQKEADIIFNSGLVYELAVLRKFIRPLLFQIEDSDPLYTEAKRLLRFLEFFLDVDNEIIPNNSIVREFIGGSVFIK
ncbi:MAG: hypothetical protein HUJ54_00500 [Erysipelotrichaceae bacterium]|nr:hypothetical protein [Erysipelotrichaceae bacterium]